MATEIGRVEELIRAAREANPGDARLAEIADEIPGEDSGEPRTEGFEAAVEDRPERLGPDLLLPAFIASVELMASHASVGYLRGGFADLGLAIQDRIASKVRSSENMLKRSYVTGITDALVEPFSEPSQLASPEARAMRSALVLTNLAKLIPGRAVPSYEIGVALDFTRVRRAARRGHWTDSTPVEPDIFGPLWPWGNTVQRCCQIESLRSAWGLPQLHYRSGGYGDRHQQGDRRVRVLAHS